MTSGQPTAARDRPADPRSAARRTARSGRRAGESGTREAILESARTLFAERGYHGATIRAIAAMAEVDPALVHHFYGTKDALFAAAMRIPIVPSEVLAAALSPLTQRPGYGEQMVRIALNLWESPDLRETFVGLIRSAVTSEQAAVMLSEFISDSILATIAKSTGLSDRVGPAEAAFRTSMVGTQMLGLALTRLVLGVPPVATASVDDLAAAIGPTLERYLTGDIHVPKRRSSTRGS